MQVKIKKENADGIVRLESGGEIKEILINEDIMDPDSESIQLCFRGKSSSGIIELSPKEIEKLYSSVKRSLRLVRGYKVISEEEESRPVEVYSEEEGTQTAKPRHEKGGKKPYNVFVDKDGKMPF